MASMVDEQTLEGSSALRPAEGSAGPRGDRDPSGGRFAPVVVIGAGQAGLATGYELRRRGIEAVILDTHDHVGDAWRARWDSLHLFTPAAYDALPGLPFPAKPGYFPTKDEMADYLEAYARRFELRVYLRTRVTHVQRGSDGFRVEIEDGAAWRAGAVVLATGGHQVAHVPALAGRVAPDIRQLHSSAYREPSQLADGDVLVVGAGNSGAEIAIESAAAGHRTRLAGRSTGHIPARAYAFNGRVMMFLARHLLTRDTPVGRRMAPIVLSRGGPLIRLTPAEIVRAGVARVGRVTGVEDGLPVADAVGPMAVRTIVWATGFRPDLGWLEPPIVDAEGRIRQDRGVAPDVADLYLVGQPFQTGFTSALIDGAGRDAARVVRHIAERLAAGPATPMPAPSR